VTHLVRALGRWTLVALVVNSVIGSGIFGLPDDVARLVGRAAPLAYLAAAAGIGVVMACFAEVSSQFTESGGPYLYARAAFGRFVGSQVGWAAWLTRLTSGAAIASLFVVYLGEFLPWATNPGARIGLLVLLIGGLTIANVRGVRAGALLNNVVTVGKLVPILALVAVGLYFVGGRIQIEGPGTGEHHWLEAILTLMFAFGGFEVALMPGGEVRDPRRDAPFAYFTALAIVTAVYVSIHLVVMGAFPDPAAFGTAAVRDRPVGEAARVFLGAPGATLVALGVLVSSYGTLAAQFLSAPRLTYALAEAGDFPATLAAVHPRFRTPYVSIVVHGVLLVLLASFGGFIWNVLLASVARLSTYAAVCGALPALRARHPDRDRFRLTAGPLFAWAGMAFCGLLVLQMRREHLVIILAVGAAAAANWAWARRRGSRPVDRPN
jgi:amino acid transporter